MLLIKNKRWIVSLIFIFALQIIIPTIDMVLISNYNLYELIVRIYGNLNLGDIRQIYPVIFFVMPSIFIICTLGRYISADYKENNSLIFTRIENRVKFFCERVMFLFIYVSAIIGILFMLTIFTSMLIKFNVVNAYDYKGIFVVYALNVLYNFLIVLSLNIISININEVYSHFIGISFIISSIFIIPCLYNLGVLNIIEKIPISQVMVLWHSNGLGETLFSRKFTLEFSFIYMGLSIIITLLAGIFLIRKKDLI